MSDPTFEEAITALEERVRKLESGDVPLDEALTLFEEGIALSKTCQDQLDAAEARVAALSRGAGGIDETALDDPAAD